MDCAHMQLLVKIFDLSQLSVNVNYFFVASAR